MTELSIDEKKHFLAKWKKSGKNLMTLCREKK